ncbi:histidine kinase, putative [Babesia ovata]|uniref:Histidine kinase, putative n=1 Tax=Babesia ovata TaxID=189622 RepID=A0A2H6KG94_9APIC|nr:histidine kinase, putative [Babesia ovata]GBE62020.1 histidine kinase, putative [Babesia ovata]
MPVLKRCAEDALVGAFRSASAGKGRLPLRRALSELARLFYGDSDSTARLSAEFMNEFYLRGVDVRCGLRSHALMVGGPKNIRGNPRGGLDARLFYPSITCEQFIMIGRVSEAPLAANALLQAMECVLLERQVPHLAGGRIRSERTSHEVADLERKQQQKLLSEVASALSKD